MRIFIGIPFTRIVKQYLLTTQQLLLTKTIKYSQTSFNNFHLTLVFIGGIDKTSLFRIINSLNNNAYNIPNFLISFGKPKTFGKIGNNILYLEIIKGKDSLELLSILIKDILRENNIQYNEKVFKPHVTLARRVEFIKNIPLPIVTPFQKPIIIDRFVIFKSERINDLLTYTPLKTIKLSKEIHNE